MKADDVKSLLPEASCQHPFETKISNALLLLERITLQEYAPIFFVGLLVYGSFIAMPGLHIDDEISAVYHTVLNDVSMGRWGTSLIRAYLIPDPFNVYFSAVFGIAVLSAAALVAMSAIGATGISRLAGAMLYVMFPQFCYQLEFHLQTDVIALSYLLACGGFALLVAGRAGRLSRRSICFILGIISITYATGIYQPVILLPATLALLEATFLAASGMRLRRLWTNIAVNAACCLVSLILYTIIAKIALRIAHVPSSSSYFADQVSWGKQPFAQVLQNIWYYISGAWDGINYYGAGLYAWCLLPGMAIIAYVIFEKRDAGNVASVIALVPAVFLSAYAVIIVMGGFQPARTYVSQGLAFGGLWAVALTLWSNRLHLAARGISFAVVLIFLLPATFIAGRLAFCDEIELRAETALGTRIVDSIYREFPGFNSTATHVFFYGNYKLNNFWRQPTFDLFAASFFDWGGSTDRIDAFLTVDGLANFSAPPVSERPLLIKTASVLPVWPASGSIAFVNGTMVVHLGHP